MMTSPLNASILMVNFWKYIWNLINLSINLKCLFMIPIFDTYIIRILFLMSFCSSCWSHYIKQPMTCSSPRRPLFVHVLSFECTSKLCITFLNQFLVYFHIKKYITQFSHWIVSCTIFFNNIVQVFIKFTHSFVAI